MPSRRLSADTKAVVKLHTRLDNEAIDVAKGRTEMPAAVARLAQLIRPPASIWSTRCSSAWAAGTSRSPWTGRRSTWSTSSPPGQAGAPWRGAHAGAERRGGGRDPLQDKLGYDRRCYRLSRHGVFVGEYRTPEELGHVVDLATVEEDNPSTEG